MPCNAVPVTKNPKIKRKMEERLKEINAKLDRILAYIDKVESSEYQRQQAENEFMMNVAANMVGERLGEARPMNFNKR